MTTDADAARAAPHNQTANPATTIPASTMRDALVADGWFTGNNHFPDFTLNAQAVMKRRYLIKGPDGQAAESPDDMLQRVAHNLAQAELHYGGPDQAREAEEAFYRIMRNLYFLPNSPTLMNAGRQLQQLSACFVLSVEDDLADIFEKVKQTALIHQSGGGTGFAFSRLRPAGDVVGSTGGIASGPVSFITAFDTTTDVIKQGGTRRGANMAILHVTHPDILTFIDAKRDGQRLQNFNISVAVTDCFMEQVAAGGAYQLINPRQGEPAGQLDAREVFDKIVDSAWATGDPGLVFIDAVNRNHPNPHLGDIESTNPCGEMPLLPNESCNLGSVNLARMTRDAGDHIAIDYQRLSDTIEVAVHMLDNVIDMNRYPLPEIEEMTRLTRRIGVGVMGWADLLVQMGIPYDSGRATDLAQDLMAFIGDKARQASSHLASTRGPYPHWDDSTYSIPMRNTAPTTIAPTGTISIIAGASSGIEPHFALSYTRNVMDGTMLTEHNPYLAALARHLGQEPTQLESSLGEPDQSQSPPVPQWVRQLFRTAHHIGPQWHVATQAAFQAHTDNAVSKTINFPADARREDVAQAYRTAWEMECKGITIYRDRSKEQQVLTVGTADRPDHSAPNAALPATTPPKPRPRPRRMTGFSERVRTGHGNMYVTVNLDDQGQPFEVFGNMGKAGGCDAALMEAVSRLISLALRTGITSGAIAEQLRGITCCPVWDQGQQVRSSPDAIALVLQNLAQATTPPFQISEGTQQQLLTSQLPAKSGPDHNGLNGGTGGGPAPAPRGFAARCPDCDTFTVAAEGCENCPSCGWSGC